MIFQHMSCLKEKTIKPVTPSLPLFGCWNIRSKQSSRMTMWIFTKQHCRSIPKQYHKFAIIITRKVSEKTLVWEPMKRIFLLCGILNSFLQNGDQKKNLLMLQGKFITITNRIHVVSVYLLIFKKDSHNSLHICTNHIYHEQRIWLKVTILTLKEDSKRSKDLNRLLMLMHGLMHIFWKEDCSRLLIVRNNLNH